MKIRPVIILLLCLAFVTNAKAQEVFSDNVKIPHTMFDVSYSNKYLFLNNYTKTKCTNGDILFRLNNDVELNYMGLFLRNIKGKHHRLYGGAGVNFSEYQINRNIFNDKQVYSGHFPAIYTYSPNKLEYKLTLLRFQMHLDHYTFYKRLMIFQKIGVAYTAFLKSNNQAAKYTEQYGNSTPNIDSAHITPANPQGWYWQDNYTYTDKNDLGIYKDGFTAFYKFGMGIRIKKITPFAVFEFSNLTGKIWSPYVKFQIGVNYSILRYY